MGKIWRITSAKVINSLRVAWPTAVVGLLYLLLMTFVRFVSASSKSGFMTVILRPSQSVALLIAIGALLTSYELLSSRSGKGLRTRTIIRAFMTDDDIYLLYTSPIPVGTIIVSSFLANLIIFLLSIMPLGTGILLSMISVHGFSTIYAILIIYIIITLAYVHGLSLYMMTLAPRGILFYNRLKKMYFAILGLTLIGPALANTPFYFISPSAVFADAIMELIRGTPGMATILSIIYFIIPLYALYFLSKGDYLIKPLDILTTSTIKEILRVRVQDLASFIRFVSSKTPIMILSYILLPALALPLATYYVHFIPPKYIDNIFSSIVFYVVLVTAFSPIELVYSSGVIVGLSGWLLYQSTKSNKELVDQLVSGAVRGSLPLIVLMLVLLGIETVLYGLKSMAFVDLLIAVITLILLAPILKIEANISIMRGIKLYMKAGNLPLAIDLRTLRAAEEEMKDRIIFAIHYLPLFGAASAAAYGAYLLIGKALIIGCSLIITGAVMYLIAIALAKIAERFFRI
ncbi:MAG: hypothetical protein GXO23_05415 [Crenarchaeota archaeon]|nr:hypothetical protein [Thermoproteota archaeon]